MFKQLILSTIFTVAVLPVAVIAAIAGSPCTPQTYTGKVCASVVTYATSNSSGIAGGEAAVSAQIIEANSISDPFCQTALLDLACAVQYPKCVNGITQTACQSTCQLTINYCLKSLQPALQPLLLAPNGNCTTIYPSFADASEPFGAANQCTAPTLPAAVVGNTTVDLLSVPCKSFFVKGNATINNHCNPIDNCCVPCPIQNYFYPKGQFPAVVTYIQIGSGISAVLAAYVVLSWAILPGRRRHPGDIVLHFAVAVMIWQSGALFLAGNPSRVQCADGATVASATNNLLCGLQGAIVMCSVHASVFWSGYMIANLHATIVWKSNVFERFKPLGVILCWGLPGVLTFLPFYFSAVDMTTGITCLISPDKANLLFFSFQAVIVIPSVFMNCATMIHIVRVARGSATSSGMRSGGYSNNGSANNKPLSPRRQILQLLKMNWRALFLGFIFLFTYVVYIFFFNLVVAKISNTNAQTVWVQEWAECIFQLDATNSGDYTLQQQSCYNQFSDNIPSFPVIIISSILVSSYGLWLFLVFGCNSAIFRDWGSFLFGGRFGNDEEEDSQEMNDYK